MAGDQIINMGENGPGGPIKSVPKEFRGAHDERNSRAQILSDKQVEEEFLASFSAPPLMENNNIVNSDNSNERLVPTFGTIPKKNPEITENGNVFQTLKTGRLLRIGVLTINTEADTQLDLQTPDATLITTRAKEKGEIRKDDRYGDVLWRMARVGNSSDERLKGRGVWIGWRRDEKGQFTIPLMHPDYIEPESSPNLGF